MYSPGTACPPKGSGYVFSDSGGQRVSEGLEKRLDLVVRIVSVKDFRVERNARVERERPQEFKKTFLSSREVFSLKKFRSDHFIHRRFGYNEKHPRENIFRAFAHYMPTRGKKERSNRAS